MSMRYVRLPKHSRLPLPPLALALASTETTPIATIDVVLKIEMAKAEALLWAPQWRLHQRCWLKPRRS